MSRSLKKGPFVHAKLLKEIEAMNAANEKKVVKTYLEGGKNKCLKSMSRRMNLWTTH